MDIGKRKALPFIVQNRSIIIKHCGRALYKEFILNYRSHYTPSKRDKILTNFTSIIKPKRQHHTSDIAIAYNILNNVKISSDEEQMLLDFVLERLRDEMAPRLLNILDVASFNIRKRLILTTAANKLKRDPVDQPNPLY